MKSCKYPNFEIRFTKEENDLRLKYDLAILHTSAGMPPFLFDKSKNQIVFNSNEKNQFLPNYTKFIVACRGTTELNLLWTSFKGKSEIYQIKSSESFYDYLIMSFCKKGQKVLYIGDDYRMCVAAWRNSVNLDALCPMMFNVEETIIDSFLKNTQETLLPF
jgi:hypothetical protein